MISEKTEKIGNVLIDYGYYGGSDLYSEGINEDILLEDVKKYPREKYDDVILSSRSWSVMYHLSHTRENIVSFLDMKEDAKVLEIGSGCGAVTGVLCKMASEVTCIELSKKRSLINAYRNSDASNLSIIVGNFEDIEPHIDEKYDYITLIGVLEYAESYINSDDPYRDMLTRIKGHLKPDGKLVIAIENKYGLKYFAGCKEDHTGLFYEGIEGYTNTSGVKTFSHDGLKTLIENAGLSASFYYPYPDYKLCHSIYSDEWLPGFNELSRNIRNYDNDRVVCFDETKAFNEIIKDGRFYEYSNSFLVLAENRAVPEEYDLDRENSNKEHVIFVKYSDERSAKYRIATVITQDEDGFRKVYKKALDDEASAHVAGIKNHYKALLDLYSDEGLCPCRCLEEAGDHHKEGHTQETVLEYVDGETMEEYLDRLDSEGRYEEMHRLIHKYRDILYRSASDAEDGHIVSEDTSLAALREIFGEKLTAGERYTEISDIDLIFENIIFDRHYGPDGTWTVIDYEWTFEGRLPVSFVIFRALFYYLRGREDSGFSHYLDDNGIDLFGEAGISEDDKKLFLEYEENFQLYIKKGTASFELLHEVMSAATLDLNDMVKKSLTGTSLLNPQVYAAKEAERGFAPDDLMYVVGAHDREDGSVLLDIELDPAVRELRIDPVERECLVKVLNAELITGDKNDALSKKDNIDRYLINGYCISESAFLFDHSDPQLVFFDLPTVKKTLRIRYIVSRIDDSVLSDLPSFLKKMREKELLERRGTIVKRGFNKIRTLVAGPVKTDDDIYPGFICNIR
ncbi:MAG: methyltransferase [Lachnospiraceae bacterium]|nr:methyltransferase [Lachnospiraceae bacterium]